MNWTDSDQAVLKRIKRALKDNGYPEADDFTLHQVEAVIRQEIASKRSYKQLYENCLQAKQRQDLYNPRTPK